MSCCGEPRENPNTQGNRQPPAAFASQNGPITQQPGAAPSMGLNGNGTGVNGQGQYTTQPFKPDVPASPPAAHQAPGGGGGSLWGEPRYPLQQQQGQPGQGATVNQWGQPSPPLDGRPAAPGAYSGYTTSQSFNSLGGGGGTRTSTFSPSGYDTSLLTSSHLPPSPPPSAYQPGQPMPGSPTQASVSKFAPSPTPLLDPTIPRPTPVYPSGTARPMSGLSGMSESSSAGGGHGGLAAMSISVSAPGSGQTGAGERPFERMPEDGRLVMALDFGTTFSGVAYGSSRISNGHPQMILTWPGSFEHFRKIPTCILYSSTGQLLHWGLEAKNAPPIEGTYRCEWFKLFLEPSALRDERNVDRRLPQLPPGKKAIDLITDYLSCMWEYAKQQIGREIGAVADLEAADVWLTVPAAWDAMGCAKMRDAAIAAGLVHATKADDDHWRDRLRIITEPEAAAVHCVALTDLHHLRPSQNFMICDAGGGTVDLAVYKLIGQLAHLEIAEICARSGANCGSLFLDLRFRELVKTLLQAHPAHLDQASLAYFMHHFSEVEKLSYQGEEDDNKMFQFTCFNVEDQDDPSVGLINGELAIPGNLLRTEVFDPVIDQVLLLIEEQERRVNARIDALLMVGGFSGSEYLLKRVLAKFGSRMRVVRPPDADTATVRGAAQYGLARRPLVQSVIAPKAYVMKVKLPAEPEDWAKRPAYIRKNDAGVEICDNRLQYLVYKGAILLKGQRIRTKFCKFSKNADDRYFTAVLYTSDSDKIMRYTDEGETTELCKWTVDLSVLPSFQFAASNAQPGVGFYTEFELGLELDSAEVRGVLMWEGKEWGSTVFDFLQAK